jgi:glutamate racemase
VPSHVEVVAQGGIIADSLVSYLDRHPEIEVNCLKKGIVSYLTSENTDEFDQKASHFVNAAVKSSHVSLH